MDVIKAERDSLVKKANAAEKYKQKAQTCQDLQKENAEIREELSEVRELYQAAELARQQIPGLQRAVAEYKRLSEKTEQDHYELKQMKKKLEFDNKALALRWEDANEQYKRYQETITDLSERLRALGGGNVPPTPGTLDKGGLEKELTGHSQNEQRLQAHLSAQNGELQKLRSAKGEIEGELKHVQQMLNDVQDGHEEREKTHLATYEELLRLQSSFAAVQRGENIQE